MSISSAGKVFAVTAIDASAGLLTSTLVEILAPPITNQSPIRLGFEGLIQLGAITYIGLEVYKSIARARDPTAGMPFGWGLFIGMPNTIAKLGLTSKVFNHYITAGFSQQQEKDQPTTAQSQ